MRCKAVYTVQVAPPDGAFVKWSYEPTTITVTRHGHVVRIIPDVKVRMEDLGDPGEQGRWLESLRVEIEYQAETLLPPDPLREELLTAATESLLPVMFSIKRETGNHQVDTRLASLSRADYLDESGHGVAKRSIRIDFPDFWQREIEEPLWRHVTADATLEGPSVEERWIVDAISFHAARDYDLAAMAAAISTETSARRALMWKFGKELRLSDKEVEDRVRALTVPEVGRWLLATGLVGPLEMEAARKTAELRNKLVHGHHREVAREESAGAIKTAVEIHNSLTTFLGGRLLPDLTTLE